jgi:heat shock protein HslJ
MGRRTLVPLIVGICVLVASAQALAQESTPTPAADVRFDLTQYVWELVEMQTGPDTSAMPDDPLRYTVRFFADGRVAVVADCNLANGVYTVDGGNLDITVGAMTMALCPEDSLSDQFVADLDQVATFFSVTETGELVLSLPADAGFLRFQPSLAGVVWEWTEFQSMDGSTTTPDDPGRYTIEFLTEQQIAVGADCNRGRGTFQRTGAELDITVTALTRALCPPDSLFEDFIAYLDQAVSLTFADGLLHLALPMDGGILVFRPQPYEPAATPEAG